MTSFWRNVPCYCLTPKCIQSLLTWVPPTDPAYPRLVSITYQGYPSHSSTESPQCEWFFPFLIYSCQTQKEWKPLLYRQVSTETSQCIHLDISNKIHFHRSKHCRTQFVWKKGSDTFLRKFFFNVGNIYIYYCNRKYLYSNNTVRRSFSQDYSDF